jgi:hypothetical protein
MSKPLSVLALASCIGLGSPLCWAQAIRTPPNSALPYSGQLRSDPAVGNLQGIQRYGRPLRTDPDEGEGYSYHVYPVANNVLAPALTRPGAAGAAAVLAGQIAAPPAEAIAPFDATIGLRRPSAPAETGALTLDGALGANQSISHQPLIQVKVRVIEVQRSNAMSVSSVLDYVSQKGKVGSSLISGNNINNNMENLRGSSRFPVPNLIGLDATGKLVGSGLLVNLTAEHINYIASFLATELNGDIVTAPEVVTLNGQNVEFIAGAKVPFEIGQNVVVDNTNNIQQFFYKHVGTYISVTPQIVNWNDTHQGRGRVKAAYEKAGEAELAPILNGDVMNWPALMFELTRAKQLRPLFSESFQQMLATDLPATEESLKLRVLKELNGTLGKRIPQDRAEIVVDRMFLYDHLARTVAPPESAACSHCDWAPQECTIDLAIVVRLSGVGAAEVDTPDRDGKVTKRNVTLEDNVRAISNIVQVKSGEGVVMAGLIGEREVETVSKVPVLGDVPVVGALFRSKQTDRAKTETLIFVEAKVLDSDPCVARSQSHDDFRLANPYLNRDLMDNPLEFGMYRAGFGTYLPPHSHDEWVYWERFGRKIRRICTEVDDYLK